MCQEETRANPHSALTLAFRKCLPFQPDSHGPQSQKKLPTISFQGSLDLAQLHFNPTIKSTCMLVLTDLDLNNNHNTSNGKKISHSLKCGQMLILWRRDIDGFFLCLSEFLKILLKKFYKTLILAKSLFYESLLKGYNELGLWGETHDFRNSNLL